MKACLVFLHFFSRFPRQPPTRPPPDRGLRPRTPLPATYVSAADIQANLNAAPNAATNPQPNIRVVDAGGYNVAVGAIHRPMTPPGVAAVHFKVSEIYHVMTARGLW